MEPLSWLSEQAAKVLIEHLPDGVFAVQNERIVYVNQVLADMLGYTPQEITGRHFIELIAPGDVEMVLERHRARLAGRNEPEHYAIQLRTATGRVICGDLHAGMTVNSAGRTLVVGSVRDITQQVEARRQLEAANEELSRIYDRLPDIHYRVDLNGIVTMVSPACLDILGYTQQEVVGSPLSNFYRTPEERQRVAELIREGEGKAIQVEAEMRHKDGSTVWILTNSSICHDASGQPVWQEGVARDISSRKRLEEQLMKLATTDSLTGAYSRSYFMEHATEVMQLMKRQGRPISVLMADLDHFKKINDTYGHHAGDKALTAFSGMCRNVIRASDLLGRIGGEEFCIVLPESTPEHAGAFADRLRKSTAEIAIPLEGREIGITVSIGVAGLHETEGSFQELMRRADLAMYRAKADGRNRVVCA